MDQEISIRMINQIAALNIRTIHDAYRHIGITCDPAEALLGPAMDHHGHLAEFDQTRLYEGHSPGDMV